jgi:hypothetical protein
MAAAFNKKAGVFNIGIYESSYQGKASATRHGTYLVIKADSFWNRNSPTPSQPANNLSDSTILTINTQTRFATFTWKNYYTVLSCDTSGRRNDNG